MKKIFFMTCLLLSAALTFAQETKKVAILEVVDREGNISYANKLILRSNLAKAVTNTPGYEAYDRTDMDAILGEQNFQRTGMVSNDQIKRLGEMTGAKFVLVAEAALVDASTMYITAKLLDVETARTEMTDNQMMGNSAKEIQRGCQLLAANLIKPAIVSKAVAHEPVVKEVRTTNKEKSAKPETEKKTSFQKSQPEEMVLSGEQLIKISSKEYLIGETKMDKKAYENFLYENCPQAWKKYKHGKNAVTTGWTFFAVGAAATIGGGVLYKLENRYYELEEEYWEKRQSTNYYTNPSRYSYYDEVYSYYNHLTDVTEVGKIWLLSGGGVFAGIGLITFSAGYGSKAAALKTYNKKCASYTPITLNLTSGQNGLGLALQF